MGFINRVREALSLSEELARAGAGTAPMSSPWAEQPSHLAPVVMNDVFDFGSGPAPVTRGEAIGVPALSRSRGLIVTTIARLPILAQRDGEEIDTPGWVRSTSGALSPFHRMLWTIDDLFFYGWSLWAVDRTGEGTIVSAERVPYDRWHLDGDGTVLVDDRPAPANAVILIPGVTEGILVHGASTIREAVKLGRSAARASENPAAQVELHQTSAAPMTDDDIDRLTARWAAARQGKNGGVAYTSSAIEVREHGASNEHLLIEGRNAAAVDVARHAGIPATMIDATLSGSSLSYSNTAARMSELVTFGLSPLMAAVAARLSQDDVTPAGMELAFDTTGTIEKLADLGGDDDAPTDDLGGDTEEATE